MKYIISERNMMDIPGCSERTNFKYIASACFMSFKVLMSQKKNFDF